MEFLNEFFSQFNNIIMKKKKVYTFVLLQKISVTVIIANQP